MTVHGIRSRFAEVHAQARQAIDARLNGTGHDLSKCLLGMWIEPDGVIVLHLNSGGNAGAVAHALWNRYTVNSDIHPEYGVLVWVS